MDGILPSPVHRFLGLLIPIVCFLLILQGFFLEPFQVPTGSMAPTLLGHHRNGSCPHCGLSIDVGRAHADADGTGGERYYRRACCPNCGAGDLHLGQAPETLGDHVLVNKSLYALRDPRRWEIVVFKLFGKTFIKRLVGLGGETIELVDGDIYINGLLARKTFEDFLGMRVLVFDNDHAPHSAGWRERWEYQPERRETTFEQRPLPLDGRNTSQQLTYRNFSLDEAKCLPVMDEYVYNGGNQREAEPVHDFMVEADVEIVAGSGRLAVALSDGGVEVEAALAVGAAGDVMVRTQPAAEVAVKRLRRVQLLAGKHYHIEVALVDRRLTLRIDGRDAFEPLDLPAAGERAPATRPVRFTAAGIFANLRHVHLYRDLHYTQLGKNAVHGRPVHLEMNQNFVLGDNSPNSEDSRFWPGQGAVPTPNLVGRAFLVHLPSQAVTWEAWGRQWHYQLPEWQRIRWLR